MGDAASLIDFEKALATSWDRYRVTPTHVSVMLHSRFSRHVPLRLKIAAKRLASRRRSMRKRAV